MRTLSGTDGVRLWNRSQRSLSKNRTILEAVLQECERPKWTFSLTMSNTNLMDERLGSHISQHFVMGLSVFFQQVGVEKSNATTISSAIAVLSQQPVQKIYSQGG